MCGLIKKGEVIVYQVPTVELSISKTKDPSILSPIVQPSSYENLDTVHLLSGGVCCGAGSWQGGRKRRRGEVKQ